MGFKSYRGGFKVGAGFKPDGTSGFPLMESCDIQIDEEGHRLDYALEKIRAEIDSPLPKEISTEVEMNAILASATEESLGRVYKYVGITTSTYEYGALYIISYEIPDGDGVAY